MKPAQAVPAALPGRIDSAAEHAESHASRNCIVVSRDGASSERFLLPSMLDLNSFAVALRLLDARPQPIPDAVHRQLRDSVLWIELSARVSSVRLGCLSRYWRAGRSQLPGEKIPDLIIALVLGVMIGGRLGSFLLYHPEQLIADPLSFCACGKEEWRATAEWSVLRWHWRGSHDNRNCPFSILADLGELYGAAWAVLRPHRKFHQRRAMGQNDRREVGRELSQQPHSASSPPSFATLRSGIRRRSCYSRTCSGVSGKPMW